MYTDRKTGVCKQVSKQANILRSENTIHTSIGRFRSQELSSLGPSSF